MKRHAALRQLSSDHHRALVLARRLCNLDQGSVTAVGVQLLLRQWQTEIAPHFVAEEEQLLPLFARFTSPDHPLIHDTLRQHLVMRGLVDAISESRDAVPAITLLHDLGAALRGHVRFEEGELFPAVEAALPQAQLQRLQQHLNDV